MKTAMVKANKGWRWANPAARLFSASHSPTCSSEMMTASAPMFMNE